MSEQVKVEDLEVFRRFRVALLKFAQAAERSLSNAESHIAHTHSWLEGEQATYWQGQLRKRTEAVGRARETLRQKKLYRDSTGRLPDTSEEEKMLGRCVAAVEQAEGKIVAIRKALPRLEKEADLYRGGVARLSGQVSVEIPRAVALLDRLAGTLEQYVQLEGRGADMAARAVPEAVEEKAAPASDAMAQGPTLADEAGGGVGQADRRPAKEACDVPDGK